MKLLSRASGTAIYQDGQRLVVCHLGTAGYYTAIFVLGLITFLTLVLGVILTTQVGMGGLIPLGIGVVAGVVLSRVLAALKRKNATPPEELPVIVVFDLERREMLNSVGARMADLSRVSLKRKMQLASSSPSLVAGYGEMEVVIARGNPFAGGLGGHEEILSRGLQG